MQYASSEDYAKYCPGGTVPPEEQDAALDAASRDIDGLTFDRIVAAGFDRLTAFQQELVKRANSSRLGFVAEMLVHIECCFATQDKLPQRLGYISSEESHAVILRRYGHVVA